jgi:hypothetical protein
LPAAIGFCLWVNCGIVLYDRDLAPSGNPLGTTGEYEVIGEAYGDWKTHGLSYEAVQGVVVDTRHLMYHYSGNTAPQIRMMADKILTAYEQHRRLDTARFGIGS